jgi:hypothetical protein
VEEEEAVVVMILVAGRAARAVSPAAFAPQLKPMSPENDDPPSPHDDHPLIEAQHRASTDQHVVWISQAVAVVQKAVSLVSPLPPEDDLFSNPFRHDSFLQIQHLEADFSLLLDVFEHLHARELQIETSLSQNHYVVCFPFHGSVSSLV